MFPCVCPLVRAEYLCARWAEVSEGPTERSRFDTRAQELTSMHERVHRAGSTTTTTAVSQCSAQRV